MTKIKVNRTRIDSFWEERTKISDPRIATHFKHDDTHIYDLKFIRQFANQDSSVLDLGCGTGCHTNILRDTVKSIKAVDKFESFLSFVTTAKNVSTQKSDILDYEDSNLYDIILLFGVMNYFSDKEASLIYKKCKKLLKPKGSLLVKHACGANEDILVDKFSKEMNTNYYALYRHVKKEQQLLSEFFTVKIIDIYPDELNPWDNTHFYAFVCTNYTD